MSVGYVAVQWSRHKCVYDVVAVGAVLLYVIVFVSVGKSLWRPPSAISDEVLILRALGSCALVLLHVILCLGPLARLDRRWLVILYNRRHLGVLTFLLALGHGALAIGYYHGFSDLNPLLSLLTSSAQVSSLGAFPFEWLGIAALLVLFVMAATSHDFWLRALGHVAWKRLHLLVYFAYAAIVVHVALGTLQSGRSGWLFLALASGFVTVATLHILAARREQIIDRGSSAHSHSCESVDVAAWIDAGPAVDLPMDRARTVCAPGGERIAVFRHADGISAVTNLCAHQGGPLAEGRIIEGCITCPWHGWQYRPHDGQSPPPFTEKIATYQVRILDGRVQVGARALPPGTPVPPAHLPSHPREEGRS